MSEHASTAISAQDDEAVISQGCGFPIGDDVAGIPVYCGSLKRLCQRCKNAGAGAETSDGSGLRDEGFLPRTVEGFNTCPGVPPCADSDPSAAAERMEPCPSTTHTASSGATTATATASSGGLTAGRSVIRAKGEATCDPSSARSAANRWATCAGAGSGRADRCGMPGSGFAGGTPVDRPGDNGHRIAPPEASKNGRNRDAG